MKYHFKIRKEGKGYWAECIEIPGCMTQGDSKEELLQNMEEAINLYLEEPEDSQYLAPFPKNNISLARSTMEVSVDPTVAFGFMVRYCRIKKGLTQKQAAKLLGMKNLFSYQRLEKKCNATLEMIHKITQVFPNFSMNKIIR